MNGVGGHTFKSPLLLAVVAAMLFAAPLAAQVSDDTEDLPLGRVTTTDQLPADRVDSGKAWVWQTLAALAVVIGLIVALRLVLQRFAGGRLPAEGKQLVEVIGRCTVSPGVHVLLLRIGRRVIVASQGPRGLTTLDVIHDAKGGEPLLGRDAERSKVTGLIAQIRAARAEGGR